MKRLGVSQYQCTGIAQIRKARNPFILDYSATNFRLNAGNGAHAKMGVKYEGPDVDRTSVVGARAS